MARIIHRTLRGYELKVTEYRSEYLQLPAVFNHNPKNLCKWNKNGEL